MVLDNSSASSEFSYDDASPTSAADPFSSQSPSAPQDSIHLDFTGLPRPLPFFGAITGWNQKRHLDIFALHAKIASQALNRTPTHDELMAFAYISGKEVRTMSFASPTGFAAGAWRAYNTRAEWRFPFWKVGEGFNPESFKLPGVGEVLRGDLAKVALKSARFTAYSIVGVVLSNLLVLPYVSAVAAAGVKTDPRLKEFNEAIVKHAKEHRAARMQGRGQAQGQQRDVFGQGQTPVSDLWKNHREEVGGPEVQQYGGDDASPKATVRVEYGDEGIMGQDTASERPMGRSAPASSQRTTPRPPQQPSPTDSSSDTSASQGFRSYNDASPASLSSQPSSDGNEGSAWDRIRQNAESSSSSQTSRSGRWRGQPRNSLKTSEASNNSSVSDGYYSSADQDRQLAKSDAQKDFDESLERERRGGDFNSSSSGGGGGDNGKRWW